MLVSVARTCARSFCGVATVGCCVSRFCEVVECGLLCVCLSRLRIDDRDLSRLGSWLRAGGSRVRAYRELLSSDRVCRAAEIVKSCVIASCSLVLPSGVRSLSLWMATCGGREGFDCSLLLAGCLSSVRYFTHSVRPSSPSRNDVKLVALVAAVSGECLQCG